MHNSSSIEYRCTVRMKLFSDADETGLPGTPKPALDEANTQDSVYLKMAARIILALFFIGLWSGVDAQPNPAAAHRMHVKFSGGVPHPVSNRAFRRSFIGVYELALTYRISLFSGFSAGLQAKH